MMEDTTTVRPLNPLAWIISLVIGVGILGFVLLRAVLPGEQASVDMRLIKPSLNAQYALALRPLSGSPSVGPIANFALSVQTPGGKPVEDAKIAVGGEMPAHGHGLPTTPRITKTSEPGVYEVDGVKFSMAGYWQLIFNFTSPEAGTDTVTFNFVL